VPADSGKKTCSSTPTLIAAHQAEITTSSTGRSRLAGRSCSYSAASGPVLGAPWYPVPTPTVIPGSHRVVEG
jgi:hypothetical protein